MRLRLTLIAVLLAVGCATAGTQTTAALPPAPSDPHAYYPLSLGWKWAYDVEKDGEKILSIYTVTEAAVGGAVILAGEEHLGYSVLPDGIAHRENGLPGDFVLKNPVRLGVEWALVDGKAKVVAVGQTITVPAGTFPNCATVEEVRSNPDRIVRTTFAAGIGPVTLEYQLHDQATGKFQVAMRANLRGVTKPGEDPLGAAEKGERK